MTDLLVVLNRAQYDWVADVLPGLEVPCGRLPPSWSPRGTPISVTMPAFVAAQEFAVHVLAEPQTALAAGPREVLARTA